jgi:hypothetical protein
LEVKVSFNILGVIPTVEAGLTFVVETKRGHVSTIPDVHYNVWLKIKDKLS